MKATLSLVLLIFALAGCTGVQSALDVHGMPAFHLKHLMLTVISVCTTVWLIVMAVLAYAVLHRRGRAVADSRSSTSLATFMISGAVGATTVIIAGLTLASFYTTRSVDAGAPSAMTIIIRGEQWWWRVTYVQNGDVAFETANEIHIPIETDIRLELESADVVHSFWVPSLAGKQDLVPGRTNVLTIQAERPGIYRGQCAEFCGLQHSHMAMLVVADDQGSYEQWFSAQLAQSSAPDQPDVIAGKAAFLRKPCAACHSVRGTPAQGTTGPDLTHVGSRKTIGAGLFERTRGTLAAWIADPQTLKPGNNMPMVPVTSDELRTISAYMDSLK